MTTAPNADLSESLAPALEGDHQAQRRFYTAFLAGPLFVPDRYQARPLSHQPQYPTPLVSILGVQDGERITIPVFSDPGAIALWAAAELRYKTLSGVQLLALVPDEWWLVVNPGAEIEKEISPWEVRQLRSGAAAIDGLIEELADNADNSVRPVELVTPRTEEYAALTATLSAFGAREPRVKTLYLLKELDLESAPPDLNSPGPSMLLVGAVVDAKDAAELEDLRLAIRDTAQVELIGGDSLRVIAGPAVDSLTLGVFKKSVPFFRYTAPPKAGFLESLRRFWRRLAGRP